MAESSQKGQKTLREKGTLLFRVISSLLTMFSKDLHCRQVKTRACLGKSKQKNTEEQNKERS